MTDLMVRDNQKELKPQLIAFDLDYTLWPFWIDTHVTPPIKLNSQGLIEDRDGTVVRFYPDVPQILNEIKMYSGDIKIAACSRSHAPKLAREALSLITVPTSSDCFASRELLAGTDKEVITSIPAAEFFDEMEIYPGSKFNHFKAIHYRTGIPYTEMLFFDDETRNREVESLGITFVWVVDGLDIETFHAGLKEWRERQLKIGL